MPPFTHPYIKFSVVGDTLINDEQTKILLEENINLKDTSCSELYMKSDSGLVYLFVPELNSFQLIYDFNALPGDTVHVFCRGPSENDTIAVVVDSLSTLEVSEKSLKVQHVHQVRSVDDKYNMNGEIIENIGWTGFMFPLHAWADPPYGGRLRCFQNDSIRVKLSEVDCDFTGYKKSDLVVRNKKWIYLIAGCYPDTAIYTDWRYKIGNDTIIDGTEYKNILFAQKNDNYTGLVGFIREEENGKVYYKRNSNLEEKEYLLYDFGMEVGDSVRLGDSNSFHRLDSVKRNSDGKKIYYLTGGTFGNNVWIEGVGSEKGLLKDPITGGAKLFSCCLLNGERLYHNPQFKGCYFEDNKVISVDAGKDTVFCSGLYPDTMVLGTDIKLNNGVPPYTYAWECQYKPTEKLSYSASDILSDTTIATPYFTNLPLDHDKLKFFLHVTDNAGNSATDSITVGFSGCGCYTGIIVIQLNKGDSVLLDAGSPIEKFVDYYWKPSTGLNTPDSSATWCKPDSTITYNLVKVDSFGCVCSCPTYEIRVTDTIQPLNVDAGEDLIICSGDNNEEYIIGGSPTATGGVEPYTYSWSGKHYDQKYPEGAPMWIYTSDIMDDTTKSNPAISVWRNVNEEWTTYYLKVEDAVGNVAYDSVNIIRSFFMYGGPYRIPDTIYRGDSVQFSGGFPILESNFEPITDYKFTPSNGLKDSTDINGWAKPDTSITYFIQATNSIGCASNWIEYWYIEVIDTTTSIRNFEESKIECYLSNGKVIINQNDFSTYNLMVTTVNGQIIHSGNYNERNLILSNLGLKPNGIYLVTIITGIERKTFKLLNN